MTFLGQSCTCALTYTHTHTHTHTHMTHTHRHTHTHDTHTYKHMTHTTHALMLILSYSKSIKTHVWGEGAISTSRWKCVISSSLLGKCLHEASIYFKNHVTSIVNRSITYMHVHSHGIISFLSISGEHVYIVHICARLQILMLWLFSDKTSLVVHDNIKQQ